VSEVTRNAGLVFAGIAYFISICFVLFRSGGGNVLDPSVHHLTIGHWQLEDGYREGLDAVIAEYEKMKAEEGIKVKITQSTIPYRAYPQWFRTQTVAGDPADIIEAAGPSSHYRYFVPLSEYVTKPNPYNVGTPAEGIPWCDTFMDNMHGGFMRGDYFYVATVMFVDRLFCNMDLIAAATGVKKPPETFLEWIDICRKVKEYGKREQRNITPIAVRGFDRGTLKSLWKYYFSQLNQEVVEELSITGGGVVEMQEEYLGVLSGKWKEMEPSLWAPAEILIELGQYFADGFTSIDLEMAKSQFFQGRVAFMIEGSYNGLSLIQNSPFTVETVPVPPIDEEGTPWSRHFDGGVSEAGQAVIWYGVTRKSKEKELAADFLQFWMSWEMNQLHCKLSAWTPIVRGAKYEGIMERFKPNLNGLPSVACLLSYYTPPGMEALGVLENMIVETKEKRALGEDASHLNAEYFAEKVKSIFVDKQLKYSTIDRDNERRYALNNEAVRAGAVLLSLRPSATDREKASQQLRRMIHTEGAIGVVNARHLEEFISLAKKMKAER